MAGACVLAATDSTIPLNVSMAVWTIGLFCSATVAILFWASTSSCVALAIWICVGTIPVVKAWTSEVVAVIGVDTLVVIVVTALVMAGACVLVLPLIILATT